MSAMRAPRTRFTPEEYLLLERQAAERSEYVDGFIYAMAGATPMHEAIVSNLITTLTNALGDRPCQVYSSNLRLKAPSDQLYSYPDVTVICGELAYHDEHRDIVTNPLVVFEVLSPSTETFDRTDKFERYREIKSLLAYLLVSQTEPTVEIRYRGGSADPDACSNEWERVVVSGLDSSARIPPIDCSLALRSIYRRLLEEGA